MNGVSILVSPTEISAGEKTTLSLRIQNNSQHTMNDVSFSLVGGSGLVVAGGTRLSVARIAPGDEAIQNIFVIGRASGRGTISFQSIIAKVLGHTERFPNVSYEIMVHPSNASAADLSIVVITRHLDQNQVGSLDFEVQNKTQEPFEIGSAQIKSEHLEVSNSKQTVSTRLIPPGNSAKVTIPVTPRQAGNLSCRMELAGRLGSQTVQKVLHLTLRVEPDQRTQETHEETIIHGDVVQAGHDNKIGHLSGTETKAMDDKRAVSSQNGGPASEIIDDEMSSASDHKERLYPSPSNEVEEISPRCVPFTCPYCHGSVKVSDKFCNDCGKPLV